MEIRKRSHQQPFTTKDGSTIRSLLDLSNAPVAMQSLAEASLPAGTSTERHYHRRSEEFYYLLEGRGMMEIDGEETGGRIRGCHPHPSRRMAPDPRHRSPPVPLLLCPALCP